MSAARELLHFLMAAASFFVLIEVTARIMARIFAFKARRRARAEWGRV